MTRRLRASRTARSTAALASLIACTNPAPAEEVPARIVEPSAAARTELLRIVSGALGGAELALADDALTDSSLLTIERRQLLGRELDRPHQFRLVLSGSRCVLVDAADGRRFDLTAARCVAE